MKKIEALFMPNRLDSVRDVMNAFGIDRFLVSEIGAHEPEQLNTRWGSEWRPDFQARLKLEVVVNNEIGQSVAQAILRRAQTRRPFECAVIMSTVEEIIEFDGLEGLRNGSSANDLDNGSLKSGR